MILGTSTRFCSYMTRRARRGSEAPLGQMFYHTPYFSHTNRSRKGPLPLVQCRFLMYPYSSGVIWFLMYLAQGSRQSMYDEHTGPHGPFFLVLPYPPSSLITHVHR